MSSDTETTEIRLTKAIVRYTCNSLIGYKYKPWEKRKLNEEIEQLFIDRDIECGVRFLAFMAHIQNPRSKLHWTINARGLQ